MATKVLSLDLNKGYPQQISSDEHKSALILLQLGLSLVTARRVVNVVKHLFSTGSF